MKVIERGTPPEEAVFMATCRSCKSKIEFLSGEVERVFDQRDGDFYRFACPVCNATVTRGIGGGR